VLGTQGLKHHHLVDPVDEFRGELAAGGFNRCAINLFVQIFIDDVGFGDKAESAVD
jgi:hypothetical protein